MQVSENLASPCIIEKISLVRVCGISLHTFVVHVVHFEQSVRRENPQTPTSHTEYMRASISQSGR